MCLYEHTPEAGFQKPVPPLPSELRRPSSGAQLGLSITGPEAKPDQYKSDTTRNYFKDICCSKCKHVTADLVFKYIFVCFCTYVDKMV